MGTIGNKARRAIDKFVEETGNVPMHYNMRFLKPIDTKALENACSLCETLITIEDGTVVGGLFSAVSEYAAETGFKGKIIKMGIPDKFIEQGSINQLMSECQYDTGDIYDMLKKSF